jgi:3-oxoacyl-(acyl-carrier-protein) synthase
MRERVDNGAPVSDPASFQKTHQLAGSEIGAPVAIAGCGVISAVGCGVGSLREALKKNASGLRPSEKFSSPRFQSNVVGTAPGNSDDENPAWSLANEALQQARESSRKVLEKISAERIGLVLSTTKANIEALERISENRPCSEMARRHLQADLLAADLTAAHGVRGPVQTVSVACVSGLVAIQQGAKMIQRGEADAVLVVGVDCLSEFVVAGFTALKALDPLGCRPFDASRCGLSPGEAGAAIVLVRADFLSQPAITIRGFGGSNDANHLTGPSRDGSGLAQAIRVALASAKLSPQEIDFVHAHGTGTSYNDAMESLALQTIFGDAGPPVSGAKGMLGHTLGAAGVIETICCVLAMQENFLPGTPRLTVPAEGTAKNLVREPRFDVRLKNILKLNTGFGGMNGALILSQD